MSRPARTRRVLAVGLPVAFVTALSTFGSWLAAGSPAGAATTAGPRRVVVVLVDRMSAVQLASVGGVQQLDGQGASGLLITATGPGRDGETPYAAVASLSAGAPAVVPAAQGQPREATSATPPSLGTLVVPGMAALRRANASATVAAVPGLLGETLEAHGISTAAIGDSDLPGHPYRPAAYLAMDGSGRVPAGSIGHTDRRETGGALPVAADIASTESATKTALSSARFVVVDWGDTARVDQLEQTEASRLDTLDATGRPLAGRLSAARSSSLVRLSTYLGFLQSELDLKRDVIVVVSPNPPSADARGGMPFAPITAAGGPVGHGSLTSGTTNVSGLVSDQDLAPSVLTWLGVAVPPQMRGHAFRNRTAGLGLTAALTDERRFQRVLRQRETVLFAASVLWIAAIGLSLGMAERRLRRAGSRQTARRSHPDHAMRSEWLARWLLFAAALLPLALLLQPLASNASTWLVLVEVLGGALVAGLPLSRASRRRASNGLGAIGILTILAMLGDRAAGGWLAQRTLMGPNVDGPIVTGLNAMQVGACVAAALLAAGVMTRGARARRVMRWFWPGLTAVVVVLLSLPFLGGATGVAAAGLTGLAVLGAGTLRRPPRRRVWERAGAALLAALVAVGIALLAGRAGFVRTVAAADGVTMGVVTAAASLTVGAVASWTRLPFATPWAGIIAVGGAAVAYAEVRFRRGPWAVGPRARLLQPADRYARATVAGMAAAAAVALLASVHGAPAAGVVLMGAAVIASAAAMERARPLPR